VWYDRQKGEKPMPNIDKILQTMREQQIPEKTIDKFILPKTKKPKPEEIIAFIKQMEEQLSKEQCISVMDEQGCNKTNRISGRFRIFGETHKDKTLEEKIALFPELDTPHKASCFLNEDGTITLKFGLEATKGAWYCPCAPIKKLKPYAFPLTYCGCCGAHARYTHEFALGVKLRLKEIVSSMANSDGERPCEFIYEIVG